MDSMSDPKQPSSPADTYREPVLPRTTRDETAEGWGEESERADSDDERYLRDLPPHHEG